MMRSRSARLVGRLAACALVLFTATSALPSSGGANNPQGAAVTPAAAVASARQPSAAKAAGGIVQVVEYYNAGLHHYFITADPAEIAALDGGAFGGVWQRTGETFLAWDIAGAPSGASQVCRFFGTDKYRADGSRIGPNSHFYDAVPSECDFVKTAWQSVAADGLSYPAWTFEKYAFAVKVPVGGVCPADTQTLYRTYNNGAGGDPNHRYSARETALQAMAGWVSEGPVMCLPPGQTATAAGAPSGAAASALVGTAGGSVSAPDGRLTVTIPSGALAGNTTIGIQPLTNMAHGKIGKAYRLTPDGQVFLRPVTLTFAYTDPDLAGTAVGLLGAAFQTADSYWQWAGDATVNTATKTVSVGTSHFSNWSLVKSVQIFPATETVHVNGSADLEVTLCYDATSPDPLGYQCEVGVFAMTEPIGDWSVNGKPGGDSGFGTVSGSGQEATYTAPSFVPVPNTVAVSATVDFGPKGKSTLSSDITIVAVDSWSGTASSNAQGITATAQVTWVLQSMTNNVGLYRPTGTLSVVIPPCSINPSSAAINPATDGFLSVDYNAKPATYHGTGGTSWVTTYTCPTGTFSLNVAGGFFGGSKGQGGVEAQGEVTPDGMTIQGSDTNFSGSIPATFTWKFTHNQ
jgi:hypothetical protein